MRGSFSLDLFQIINKEEKQNLEYHHFATPTKLMDLSNDHQWLILQKE